MSKITFSSTRTFTFGEIELADKARKGDITAAIDLMVARSDPKVTRDEVCALDEGDILQAMRDLTSTVAKLVNTRKMFGG